MACMSGFVNSALGHRVELKLLWGSAEGVASVASASGGVAPASGGVAPASGGGGGFGFWSGWPWLFRGFISRKQGGLESRSILSHPGQVVQGCLAGPRE